MRTHVRAGEGEKKRIIGHGGRPKGAIPIPATNLSRRLGPLPDAEVAHDPCDEQAQGQVPVQRAHVVDARGDPQRTSPVGDTSYWCVWWPARHKNRKWGFSAALTPRTP